MTKYNELFEILKDEVLTEKGDFNLNAPENADVLKRAQECVARIEKTKAAKKDYSNFKFYAFNVSGEVKLFKDYKSCASELGIPSENVSKYINKKTWANWKWQIRHCGERAELSKVSKPKLLRFKKAGVEKLTSGNNFCKSMGIKYYKLFDAINNHKLLDGWSVEHVEINVHKLVENGVSL